MNSIKQYEIIPEDQNKKVQSLHNTIDLELLFWLPKGQG